MKFKKVVALFVVSVCISVEMVSQEYKTEQMTVSDTVLAPKVQNYRINPYSDDYRINRISIPESYFERKVSSKNGIDFNLVSYTITPKGKETIVFYGEYDAMTENKYELFITEENFYKIKIPKFSWSGTALPIDNEDYDVKQYIRDDGKVIDGEYVLKIGLLRYADSTNKEKESFDTDIQLYNIEIDTTPPVIDFKILYVCEDFLENNFSRYIVPKNHGKEENKYLAKKWQIIGDKNSARFFFDSSLPLPAVSLESVSNGGKIKIIAIDDLENKNETGEIDVVSKSFDLPSPQPEEKNLFEYFKAIQEILSPFCQKSRLDMAKSFCTKFYIPQDKQEIIQSNFEENPPCIVFSANLQSEIRIPIECFDNTLSFDMTDKTFSKDFYHIFISDGNNVAFSLGQKYIYDSDAWKKIRTLVGFDGRNYLDEPDILFPASCPSFLEDDELAIKNLQSIKSTVEIINDNIEEIDYVEILGYANPERSDRGDKILIQENEDSLLPLSKKRAEYVKQIMELMGIPEDLLVIVSCGGVPYETNPRDKENSYKNRRVRINVVKK